VLNVHLLQVLGIKSGYNAT